MKENSQPTFDPLRLAEKIRLRYGVVSGAGSTETSIAGIRVGSALNQLGALHLDADELSAVLKILDSTGETSLADLFLIDYVKANQSVWNYWALFNRFRAKREFQAALSTSEVMLSKYPEYAVSYSSNVQALIDVGRSQSALAAVEGALKQFPRDQWLNTFSATLAEQRHDYLCAFRSWKTVLELAPQHEHARIASVQALLNMDRHKEAIDLLRGESVDIPGDIVYGEHYSAPADLAVSETPIRRMLIIGSCLASGLPLAFANAGTRCKSDFILVNNFSGLPKGPPVELSEYDIQILQIPLRSIMPEAGYLLLDFNDVAGYESFFSFCCSRIAASLREYLKWNVGTGLLTFVTDFLVPQQSAIGRLLYRDDLRNPVWFVERLNQYLNNVIREYRNTYVVDMNAIAAGIGTRYIQDDALWTFSHGAALADTDFEHDRARLEALAPASVYYPLRTQEFVRAFCREIEAMYRTARQIDMVKMIIVDLDDTLWRGVLAESGETNTEGWPQGLWEALSFLKKRGVLLGIVSKNDEERVRKLWAQTVEHVLPFDRFAVAKINWRQKAENIEEILADVKLLPKSVLYLDDNPVERAAIAAAFPEMRILGGNPYLIRRVLLWAPETQVASISYESSRRGEMVRSQVEREQQRRAVSSGEFLESLSVRVKFAKITSCADVAFSRTFELLNKTNQFNTTGTRWSFSDAEGFFGVGGVFYVMRVADKFTDYGLVGVMCVNANQIEQFAMSCRVIGLEVEIALAAYVLTLMSEGGWRQARAKAIDTDANLVSRDVWQRCDFSLQQDMWIRDLLRPLRVPCHVTIVE